jgi:hypothetical protein
VAGSTNGNAARQLPQFKGHASRRKSEGPSIHPSISNLELDCLTFQQA